MKIWISMLIVIGMLGMLTGCREQEDDGRGYLFICTLAGNPGCIDPQYTDNENAEIVMETIMEGLMRLDETGNLVMAGAEEYSVSRDRLCYRFRLREDSYWYTAWKDKEEAEPVTASDYVYAFRRLLNPETGAPHAEEYLCLKNAAAILSGQMKPEELGVTADGETVIFELDYPEEDFLYLLTQSCTFPCNEEFFLSTNGRYGLNEQAILCNGAFYLTKWVYDDYGSGNFMTFQKNSMYYDAEEISPVSLQFNLMHTQREADEDFAHGYADIIFTGTYPVNYLESEKYVVQSSCAETLGLVFNPENEILQSEAFRKALAYGIDRESYAMRVNGNLQPASGIIPPAVQILGRSYRELYADEPLIPGYAPEESERLFAEVISMISINEFNALKILLPETFTDTEALLSICQGWQDISGHYIGIEQVSVKEYESRIESGEYSIALRSLETPWNSCYASIRNSVEQLGAEASILESLTGDESLSEKVYLYGEAEREILAGNEFIPLFYQEMYLIYTADNAEIYARPFSRSIDFRKAKHYV